MRALLATAILVLACVHEFAWQAFPYEVQGMVTYVTQWAFVCALCAHIYTYSATIYEKAVALCGAAMSSGTALCSVAYIIKPWSVGPGEEQCSAHFGPALFWVSILLALVALTARENPRHDRH